jgi:hypothetical protein
VLATEPGEHGVFYAACNRGLFRSDDRGLHWRAVPLDLASLESQQGRGVNGLLVTA